MRKKIFILALCLLILSNVFLLSACGKSEIEKNWSNEGAWSEIYVYKGSGEFTDMNWSYLDKKGTAMFLHTDVNYTKKYVALYQSDNNYRKAPTGLPNNYSDVAAFETLDSRLWVRIMWTDKATFLLVRIYE